jgi:hypothetical protein
MAEPTRGQDCYPGIALPGFNRIPERYAKFIGPPWPRLIGWVVGILHDGHHRDVLSLQNAREYEGHGMGNRLAFAQILGVGDIEALLHHGVNDVQG